MAIIKCKMCGGDLNIQEGMTVCECEYCGSKQTVPSADNEKKLTLFARANRLRAACEFDKAAGVYESIVADFPEEAEAYWGLVLCRYGIEYVDDPATGKKIPTCHRSSFDSIMEDADFEQACENADAIARRVYRDEAKAVEEIRKGIIEVSGKEEPYDIFICYKETDESGDRTVDSVIAQDVYDALTDKGYRVFFSRISLEDKLGVEYEPYIFAALNSAKIMLAFGTDFEYYNAVWVKNEWSRFLKLMAADKTKYLIPCFKSIDAYDMPKEFAKLQAQNMGKVGAMQDLLRGIEKILPKAKPETVTVQQTVVQTASGGPNSYSLLKRGFMALEDGEWDKADDFFEEVLNMDAECGEAYLGKLMAELQVSKREKLKNCEEPFDDRSNCQKLMRFGDAALIGEVIDANESIMARIKAAEERRIAEEKAKESHIAELTKERMRILPAANRIAAGDIHTVGLKSDGTVVVCGENDASQCDVDSWPDIIAIASGTAHTVGLKSDGTVVACGYDYFNYGFCNVGNWSNITAVSASDEHTVGLRSDGTVVACGRNEDGECNVGDWTNIVAIAAGVSHTVGLKSDGTVVACGEGGECNVGDWTNIVAIAASGQTVGLKSDGTVVACGRNEDGECNVGDWTNIVAIAAGGGYTVGLKSDATVIACGFNEDGECNVKKWTDVVAIAAGGSHTVGLKSDGTVIACGDNEEGQCNVGDWKLFNSLNTLEQERNAATEKRRIAEEKVRQAQIAKLNAEKSNLTTELSNLKGFFSGKRKKEIEARLAEIDAELNN